MLRASRSKGFTLVEVMVAVGILVVLSALLYFTVGPAMKAKAWETRIRSDLRQIVLAINLYRQDHDDRLPLKLTDLPKGTPLKIEGWPQISSYSLGLPVTGDYLYMQPYLMQVYNERFARAKWDPEKNPIVMAKFFRRDTGSKVRFWTEPVDGQGYWFKVRESLALGGFLDGSVRWATLRAQYEWEAAERRHLLGGMK